MDLYRSVDTIPVYYFFEIFKTKDFKYLIVGYESNKNIEVGVELELELQSIFKRILYDYSNLSDNNKIKIKFDKLIEIAILEDHYNYCSEIIDLYRKHKVFEILELLSEFNYTIREDNIVRDLNTAIIKLKGVKNKIKIRKIKFSKVYGDKSNGKESSVVDLDEQAVYLQMNLKTDYLDIRKIPLSRWVSMLKINKKMIINNGTTKHSNASRNRRN